MSESRRAVRVYSEKEIAKILERATDVHRTEARGGHWERMTLAELEDVAGEAVIDV
jgi:hypothetical protein